MSSRISLLSLVIVVLLAPIVRSDLVHRYSFNNGDTTAVDSVGGKHGTLVGGATISGNAVQLNGTGAYVSLPANLLTNFTSVTFEAWFTYTDNGSWTRVFDFGETNSSTGLGRYYIFYTPQSSAGTSRLVISDADPGYNHEEIVNYPIPATTVPVYIACVYNGSNNTMGLYVDGELGSSISVTIPLSSVKNNLSYLGRSLYNDPYLKGSINEFRIYNNVLSSDEISVNYILGPDAPYAPYIATGPNPTNGSASVPPSIRLSWTLPTGGTPDSYTVYVSNNPNFTDAQIIQVPDGNSCTPLLSSDTTYYWRVDTHYGAATYKGIVWTFTTCLQPMNRSGDINGDYKVDFLDLKLLVNDWLGDENSPANLNGLVNSNGIGVDFADYTILANHWLMFASPIVINEFMASNTNSLSDENGDFDDWIEIYNCSITTIDLSGMYLTDNLSKPTKWRIPNGVTIAPKGYLLFWADGEVAQGNTHTNFKLDADGEEIGLFDTDGSTLLDNIVFDQQYPNISYGRHPDDGQEWWFFDIPTPRACNCQGYQCIVAEPRFSADGGLFSGSSGFDVFITCDTAGATIRYTTDFTKPTESSQIYSGGPIHISSTTCLRAIAFKPGCLASHSASRTYVFLNNVVNQSANPPGFPTSWGANVVDYEVDPDVVSNPEYSSTFKDDLKTIPSVCIVIPNDDFFGAARGIYANATQRGDAWEREASMEFIDPVEVKYFQVNAGLRSQGGVGREPGCPKHSLRILFKSQYGPSKLNYPLFKDSNIETFDDLVLRAGWNYTWTGDSTACSGMGTDHAEYNRDQYARDTVQDMGGLQPYGRHVYLYINGLYWGLYNLTERPDDGFASAHLGGSKSDYDVIKTNAEYWTGPNVIEVIAGDRQVWDQLFALAAADLSTSENYAAIQQYVDIPALIDYMLMIFHTGSRDAPVLLCNDTAPRNFYAIHKREPGALFVFSPWDVEWSLEDTGVDRVNVASYIYGYENPAYLFARLEANAEFRMLVADHVHKYFFNDGQLTPQKAINRYHTRIMDIDRAIVGESARWGDTLRPAQPYTRNIEWITEVNRLTNNYFPVRTDIVLSQLRTAGLYPNFDAPVFNINSSPKYGGQVNAGDLLTMTASTGTIYYTLDGSDPRLPGGAVNPIAQVFSSGSSLITLIAESASKKVFVPTSDIGITWKGANEPYDDSGWTHGTFISGKTGGVGYDNETTYLPYITYDVKSPMYNIMPSCYIRIPFTISSQDLSKLNSLTFNVRCDDGFVAYINGQEVANINKPNPLLWNSTCANRPDSVDFVAFDITDKKNTLQAGTNILAIQAMNQSTNSSDLLCSVELKGTITNSIVLTGSTRVKARVLNGGQWSALSDATFTLP